MTDAHDLIRAFARAEHSMAGEDPTALVRLLQHALPVHFHAEDGAGGVYEELALRGVAPALLSRLRADHRSFLDALDGLARDLDHGEDVRGRIWELARQIRVHERREAAAGIQVGVRMAPPVGMPAGASAEVATVADRAAVLATEVPGRLLVGIVANVDATRWAVEDALTAAGLEFVEVRVVREGPVGLQRATFEASEGPMDDDDTTVRVALDAELGYRVSGEVRGHAIVLDEPVELHGSDAGPTPVEALLAALGACTAMTVRMYALRKGWALRSVEVTLSHRQLARAACLDCPPDEALPTADRIRRSIAITGDLDADQRQRLLDIANRCPVHRILTGRPTVVTELRPNG